jgi:hypothetical protein
VSAILMLLRSKTARLVLGGLLLVLAVAFDQAYHQRLKNQRDAAILQTQKDEIVIAGFEAAAQAQAARQAAAAEKAKAMGAKTQAIIRQIQAGPQPKTTEEVRQWLISQGKVVIQ